MVDATASSPMVTGADIARLTGYGRAAVSNWRRRHEDFPEPVGGTAGSPLFELSAVERWLEAQGKHVRVSAEERLWQRIRSEVDDLQLGDVVGELGAFLVFHLRCPETWTELSSLDDMALAARLPGAVASAAADLPGGGQEALDPSLLPLLRSAAELTRRPGALETFEFFCDRFVEAHSRRVATTPSATAAVMAVLSDVSGVTVLDPGCGLGALGLAALGHGAVRLLGQDRDTAVARIAAARLLLRDADARIDAGDSLRADAFPTDRADIVLCDPPFGDRAWGYDELPSDPRWVYGLPPRGEPELAWVQHALAHLRPGGRAAVLMPAVAAGRRSGRRIRSQLLRTGALRAVLELPAGSASASTASPHLWLLRRPAGDDPLPTRVLMMDVSDADLSAPETGEAVAGRWRGFAEEPEAVDEAGVSKAVALIDLLDDEVDLTPSRYVGRVVGEGSGFGPARDEVAALAARLGEVADTLRDLAAEVREVPMTTVGELIQSGALSMKQPPVKMETESGELPLLTAKDVMLGCGPTGRTKEDAPGVLILRRGDVVVPTLARQIEARVVSHEGAAAGPQLQVFRPDPERVDPYFLAGFLRSAGSSRGGSISSRSDVRRAAVPRLPLGEQRPYGKAFERLETLSAVLRDLNQAGETLVALGFEGLTAGVLSPNS